MKKIKQLLYITVLFIMGIVSYLTIGPINEKDTPTLSIISSIQNQLNFPFVSKKVASVEKPIEVKDCVKRGDTIINLLKRGGLSHFSAYQFFEDIKPIYNLRNISIGNKYIFTFYKKKDEIKHFKYEIDLDCYLESWKDQEKNCYIGQITKIPYEVKKEFISGDIQESLFESIVSSGERPEVADIMASLFEYDIDFNRDIQKNDSFALMVEKMYLKGKFIRYGYVLAAQFTNRGKTIHVIRYTDPEGKTAYYHPDGRSVRKMFLRCPLPFMRVTSGYGRRRHPLKNFSARHLGIDLAAPVGTKIRVTASGIVKQTGYSRIKGRFITVRHKNHYITHYYHLYRIEKGIKPGKRVEQGQIIGYVGSSGWSTGSHLHYGMQKYSHFMNPLRLKSPTKDPVKKVHLNDFKQYASKVLLLLSGSQILEIPETFTDALLDEPVVQKPIPMTSSISIGH